MIKVLTPNHGTEVIDRAMQACGARGPIQDSLLTHFSTYQRRLRVADALDEGKRNAIVKQPLAACLWPRVAGRCRA